MPAEALFQLAENRPRQAAEIPFLAIAVLFVIANAVREDVIRPQLRDVETMTFHERATFASGVNVRDGAAGLRLGVFRDQIWKTSELVAQHSEAQTGCTIA